MRVTLREDGRLIDYFHEMDEAMREAWIRVSVRYKDTLESSMDKCLLAYHWHLRHTMMSETKVTRAVLYSRLGWMCSKMASGLDRWFMELFSLIPLLFWHAFLTHLQLGEGIGVWQD